MKHRLLYMSVSIAVATAVCAPSYSQSTNSDIMAALNAGKTDEALSLATALYDTSAKSKDEANAGYAAYAKAQIFDLKNMPLEAAEAYDDCADHYGKIGSAAQSLQCRYQSGLSFYAAGKTGTASDVLKSAAKELEKIGQDKSELAANVYLALAKSVLPSKLTRKQSATNKRKAVIEYVDKALLALDSVGQKQTQLYASGLFMKGIALEDSQKYEAAAAVYKETVDLAKTASDIPADFKKKAATRHAIAKSHLSENKESDSFFTKDIDGNEVELRMKKKRKIKVPRLSNNTMVDGATVKAKITLEDDGRVAKIDIMESRPSAEYGEAFVKAVKTWTFIPPEGVSGTDIPPFNYNMTFSVYRR